MRQTPGGSAKLMMAAYLLGQGVYFLILGTCLVLGYSEFSGWLAYKMTVVSFVFQLADLGAANVLLSAVRRGDRVHERQLLLVRCAIAFLASAVISVIALFTQIDGARQDKLFHVLLPFVATFAGFSRFYLLETGGMYKRLATLQAAMWVGTLILGAFDYYLAISDGVLMFIPILVVQFYCGHSICGEKHVSVVPSAAAVSEMGSVGVNFAAGQVWARVAMGFILSHFGPAAAAAIALARGVITAVLLLYQIRIRTSFAHHASLRMRGVSDIVLLHRHTPLAVLSSTVLAIIIAVGARMLDQLPFATWSSYFPLVLIVPIWLLYLGIMHQWMFLVKGWRAAVVECFSTGVMVSVFYLVVPLGPVAALVLSDAAKALSFFAVVVLARSRARRGA